ncbi:MAG: sigma-70 family RNA polymerase sigma factor [Planctomycetota bacterium]
MKAEAETLSLEKHRLERESISDARLVEQVRQGDRSAYGELVRRYEKKLLRTLYRMVGNVDTCEDLAQEAFLKAYDRLDRFDTSKRFGPWLFQIGVNTAIDWLRRHRRHHQVSLSDMAQGEGTFDVSDPDPRPIADLNQEVHYILAQIPIDYRTVLMLRDLEGFPCSEVAAIVGRKEPTVRWRLLKAREMFRDLWERREGKTA